MPKLMINGKEMQPTKKVKLYREIPSARVREILENPDNLKKLKDELKKLKEKPI